MRKSVLPLVEVSKKIAWKIQHRSGKARIPEIEVSRVRSLYTPLRPVSCLDMPLNNRKRTRKINYIRHLEFPISCRCSRWSSTTFFVLLYFAISPVYTSWNLFGTETFLGFGLSVWLIDRRRESGYAFPWFCVSAFCRFFYVHPFFVRRDCSNYSVLFRHSGFVS